MIYGTNKDFSVNTVTPSTPPQTSSSQESSPKEASETTFKFPTDAQTPPPLNERVVVLTPSNWRDWGWQPHP